MKTLPSLGHRANPLARTGAAISRSPRKLVGALNLSLRHTVLVFLLDCMQASKLLKMLRSEWCIFNFLLARMQSSKKTSIVCHRFYSEHYRNQRETWERPRRRFSCDRFSRPYSSANWIHFSGRRNYIARSTFDAGKTTDWCMSVLDP